MNVTIKNLPDHVGASLKEAAATRGLSLNAYLIQILTEPRTDRQLMQAAAAELRAVLGVMRPVN